MKFTKIKRFLSAVLAVVVIFGTVAVNSVAAPASPLLEMDSAIVDLGEEFQLSLKFARSIASNIDPLAALDISLVFDENVYEFVSMEIGAGLQKAFDLTGAGDTSLEKNYSYGAGTDVPGVVKWSMITVNNFTFIKGEEFMKIKFKVKEIIDDAEKLNINFTLKVTNAAEPNTLKNVTDKFTSFTNEMKFKTELDTKCGWAYVKAMDGYRLTTYVGNSKEFVLPATHDDLSDDYPALPIVSIGAGAFRGNNNIEQITIGKNVTDVSIGAFMSCSKLKKLIVYSPSITFGPLAFENVSKNLIIKCIKDSDVAQYALENGYTVEYFDDVADCVVEGTDEKLYYTGVPASFTNLTVKKADGTKLVVGTDYFISYENNVEIGKATLKITGNGEYIGEKTVEFDVLCPHHNKTSGYYTERIVYADCTTGGKVIKDCSFCQYHDESETLPAKEHGVCEWVVAKDSTCSEFGEKQFVCPDCNIAVEKEQIAKKEHIKGSEWKQNKAPECEEKGNEVIYCENCDYIFEFREIDATGHTYKEVTLKEATCTEKGSKADVCEVCEDIINQEDIPEIPHTMQWVTVTEPKCDVTGEEAYLCTVCGHNDGTENRPIDALVCTEGDWEVLEPVDCLKDGKDVKRCIYCQRIMEERDVPQTGHTPDTEWTEVIPLKCMQDGFYAIVCLTCGEYTQTKTETAPGHIEGEVKTVEAGCLIDGSVDHYCGKCGEIYKQEPIAAPGQHTSGEWRTVEPRCLVDGAENHHCSVCDEIYETNPIPQTGHTEGEWKITTDGGCENDSIKSLLCAKCEEPLKTETVTAPGHKLEFVAHVLPTYKTLGVDRVVCAVCEKVISEVPVRKVTADIDDDGRYSASDALLILQYATGLIVLEGSQLKNADLDGTGRINSSDALIALQIATGILETK